MVIMLNDIANELRNTSHHLRNEPSPLDFKLSWVAIILLSTSLGTVLLISSQALYLKHWLSSHTLNWETLHNPEEEARKRELYAQGLIAVCKKVGVGLCAPPSFLVLAPRKLRAGLSNVYRRCK